MGIAVGMNAISLDLTWNPDHPLSTESDPLPQPTAEDWYALDDDLWVASVDEGDYDRLWFKSDIQDPTPAPATDIRAAYVQTRSHFVVIIIGEPLPEAVTVNWDDGGTETAEPTWNTDLAVGFARFEDRDARVLSVDGP
jgi:hypothetical protein